MIERRQFIQTAGMAAIAATTLSNQAIAYPRPEKNAVSLATWSLVRSFRAGVWKLTDIPRICREDFNIDGIEFVNQFFEVPTSNYLNQLNKAANDHGVKNVLIMVDQEGSMVATDQQQRKQAVINHRKWIDIAAYLNCHAIRCNAHGGVGDKIEDDADSIKRAAESFNALLDYAKEAKINVIIENHGGLSSDPRWLPKLCEAIDSPHFGLLPDYGNYREEAGIDVYKALEMAMPYAKGVSVKVQYDKDGNAQRYDIKKLLQISKDAGFTGFWGIECSLDPGRELKDADDIKQADWQAVKYTKRDIDAVVM